MTEQITRELTCVGPPAHTWTCSRHKGARGTWPQRCPTHKAQHLTDLRNAKNARMRLQRTRPVPSSTADKVATAAHDMQGHFNRFFGLPTATNGTSTPTVEPAEHTCPQLPADLQRIDRLADQVLPDKRTFRQAVQAISQTHSERAYENLAAVCIAAARLLRGPKGQKQNGGST